MQSPAFRPTQARGLITDSPLRDLEAIIRSRTPLIAAESNEEPQIVQMVRKIGQRMQVRAFRWTVTDGMRAFDPNDQPRESVVKSHEILDYIKSSASNSLFALLDFHPYLQDAMHVRQLKDIALNYPRHYSTVVLVGYALAVPEELKPFTAFFRMPLPTPDELRGIVCDVAAEWGADHGRRDVQTTNKALDLLVRCGMAPIFELMGNPNGQFSDFNDDLQLRRWRNLVRDLVLHLVERYGVGEVKSWAFETWNEPDIGFGWRHQWPEDTVSFCRYYDACVDGLDAAYP